MAWYNLLSPKSIDTAVVAGKNITDGVIAGLDKIWHTDEEKSDAREKGYELFLKYMELNQDQNSRRSVARAMRR